MKDTRMELYISVRALQFFGNGYILAPNLFALRRLFCKDAALKHLIDYCQSM
jgi:hypothetical protein